MLDVGIDSREMMIVFRGFRTIHVVCLWICVFIENFEGIYHFG
jgi:hypothetical protein